MAALPAREVPVATYAGTAAIARIAQGMDLVIIRGGLTVMQEMFVRQDSSVKSISDLRGKNMFSSHGTEMSTWRMPGTISSNPRG